VRPSIFGRAALAALATPLALLISCSTSVPQRPTAQWLGILPAGCTFYASLLVQPSAAALKRAVKDAGPAYGDLPQVIDKTKKIFLGVTRVDGGHPRFSVVALGNYPSLLAGLRLGTSSDWSGRTSSAVKWYRRRDGGLEVCIPSDSVFLASNGGMEGMVPRLKGSPAMSFPLEVGLDMESSDFVLFMPELPQGLLDKSPDAGRPPIKEVWVSARRDANGFAVGGTANLDTQKDALSFASVFRLILVSWLRSRAIPNVAGRLKTVTVAAQDGVVTLSGLFFTEDETVAALLSLLAGAAGIEERPL
jgi:hypothetical protein